MKIQDAIEICHIRSAIYRKSNPSVRYWKNSLVPLDQQVTWHWDRDADDWEEYDPHEGNVDRLPCGHHQGIIYGEDDWTCPECGQSVRYYRKGDMSVDDLAESELSNDELSDDVEL
jgi:rubredoxin